VPVKPQRSTGQALPHRGVRWIPIQDDTGGSENLGAGARIADVITGNRDFAPAAEPALAIRLMFDGRFSGRTGAGRRTARADPDGTVLRQVSRER